MLSYKLIPTFRLSDIRTTSGPSNYSSKWPFYCTFSFKFLEIILVLYSVFGVHVRSHRDPLLKGRRAELADVRFLVGVNPYVAL